MIIEDSPRSYKILLEKKDTSCNWCRAYFVLQRWYAPILAHHKFLAVARKG